MQMALIASNSKDAVKHKENTGRLVDTKSHRNLWS